MSSSGNGYEKSVKGGTKTKLAAPKAKYVQHLLDATRHGEAAIGEVFRALQYRLKDPTWTVVFKSLILTHMLIRDGYKDSVLDYLTHSHQFRVTSLTSTGCSPMSQQGRNINDYGAYLTARIKAFASVKSDYVKSMSDQAGQGRLRKLSIEKGLLRETESVQKIIGPLIQCKLLENEVDNEITLTAFRLLVADLLVLFQVANEGVINVLEHYFEMSKPDAERALAIYQRFVEQTDGVIVFMSLARSLESITRLEIPDLQHAPTSLGNSLEEYINDPDFEQNRIQYLAQKSNGTPGNSSAISRGKDTDGSRNNATPALKSVLKRNNDTNPFGTSNSLPQPHTTSNSDLIDFFASIETPPQPMQSQQSQYVPQSQGPVQAIQMQPYQTFQGQFTQADTNPYLTQAQNSSSGHNFNQVQVGAYQIAGQPSIYGTNNANPIGQSLAQQPIYAQMTNQNQQLGSVSQHSMPQPGFSAQTSVQSLQPQTTGANPFRRSMLPPANNLSSAPVTLNAQRTGGNPFARASPANLNPPPQHEVAVGEQSSVVRAQTTGNPFAKNRVVSASMAQIGHAQVSPMQVNMTGNLMPQQTGSSNPFRRSMMPPVQAQPSYSGR